jgi:hypothetical protein
MLKLEYDDKGRLVVPHRRCGNRVAVTKGVETYCTYELGHEGKCELPPVKPVVAVAIPCSCVDCVAKRNGIKRK